MWGSDTPQYIVINFNNTQLSSALLLYLLSCYYVFVTEQASTSY